MLVGARDEFRIFHECVQNQIGKTYFFCYDQGYLPLDNDFYALVVKEDYVG
jgi:hypothetical protein